MAWITTTNDDQVRFQDAEMDDPVEWSTNRKAQVDGDTAEYLVEAYDDIEYVDNPPDSDDSAGDDALDSEFYDGYAAAEDDEGGEE